MIPTLAMLVLVDVLSGGNPEGYFAMVRNSNVIASIIVYFLNNYIRYCFYAIYIYFLIKIYITKNKKLLNFTITFIIVHLIVSLIVVQVGKHILGFPRPIFGRAERHWFTTKNMFHAMPSGHTTEAAVSGCCLAQLRGSNGAALLWGLIPALVGLARIYVGMHHSADVLAGSVLGSLAGVAVIWRTDRLNLRLAGESEPRTGLTEAGRGLYGLVGPVKEEETKFE
jgi:undecaprenyl-diphosphatase